MTRHLPMRARRSVPVLALLVLAPWVGEFLLGNLSIRLLPLILLLVPMYGGGALLIREVVRRTGRGYPAMLLLGAAYGVAEAGLADLTLFNPPLGPPGLDPVSAVSFVAGHAIWSITVPIAIAEMLAGPRRCTPWLGRRGLAVTAAAYVGGCALILSDAYGSVPVRPTPAQVGAVLLAVAAFVAWGLLAPPRIRPATGPVPPPLLLAVLTFVAASLFAARPETWLGLAWGAVLLITAWVALRRWSQAPGWGAWHGYALVAGALPVNAWLSFVLTHLLEPGDPLRWAGNVLFTAAAAVLLVLIARRVAQQRNSVGNGAGSMDRMSGVDHDHGMRLRLELFADDLDTSIAFYTEVLGFRLDRRDGGYASLSRGQVVLGLGLMAALSGQDDDGPGPAWAGTRDGRGAGVEIVLELAGVDEVRDLHEHCRSRAVTVEPLRLRPWGLHDFRLFDPDGYYLRVTHRDVS